LRIAGFLRQSQTPPLKNGGRSESTERTKVSESVKFRMKLRQIFGQVTFIVKEKSFLLDGGPPYILRFENTVQALT
jgi:hypothetical protein